MDHRATEETTCWAYKPVQLVSCTIYRVDVTASSFSRRREFATTFDVQLQQLIRIGDRFLVAALKQ